jgi:hypothetical protein
VLNASATVSRGTAFYHEAGYRGAYLALTGIVLLGLLVSLAIPAVRRETHDH